MVFSLLDADVQALLAREGWSAPTAAQEAAIPAILAGKHTLLLAPTGMGKTESAILPLFTLILRHKRATIGTEAQTRTSLLYVTPLRALNRDLLARLHDWGKRLGIDVRVRHGDTTPAERDRQARHPPDVLITTPETLQLLFLGSRLRRAIEGVKWVVLDEVHELASDERGAQLGIALERLVDHSGEFQRIGLSATVGDPVEVAAYLGGKMREVHVAKVPVAKRLDLQVISPKPHAADRATAQRIMARPEAAAFLNAALVRIGQQRQTLLFVNTRETAEVLAARIRMLREHDESIPPIVVHHGSLARDVRVSAEHAFKTGQARGLICTSSMELGIDIGDADLVLQMTSPRQVTRLVQRVGRAGHRHDLVSNGVVIAQDPDDIAEAAVIVRHTILERMEKLHAPRKPLDVLANQIAAMALTGKRIGDLETYRTVSRAHSFRDLTPQEFADVLKQVHDLWVVKLESGVISSKKRTRDYFYENISMIPDEQTYRVQNLVTRRSVATLSEGFIASFAEPGAVFIVQGQPWRIAEIDAEKLEIHVEPIKDPSGAIPSWIGEEIPVPYDVAQGVGALRQAIRNIVEAQGEEAAAQYVSTEFRVDRDGAWSLVEYVEEQGAYALPTDTTLCLDLNNATCVLHACFGTQVNETIGRILASLLTARLGSSVGLDIDPYRIVLTLPTRVKHETIREVLLAIDPDHVESLLHLVLQGSTYLKYRLFHSARKFGALDREIDYQRVNVGRLLDVFKGTPLHKEALREVFEDKLDIPRTIAVLRALRSGELKLVEQGLSPIGVAGLDRRIELISPARADKTLLAAIEQRLQEERVLLGCLNCRAWKSETRVKRAAKSRACPKCGGKLLGITRPWNELGARVMTRSKGASLTPEEQKELQKLATSANLFLDHGERALLALAARGVGPETAGRILAKQSEGHEAFLRAIMEAEINYAKTRQFWN
ncbi:MAG TPA: DEAD/DEAH box helicase [Candidatus Thermoplasmatota archaeon]|nr:DEAD/DEAH box helicase [Candidatus Thermoplasmatota archaeon]